MKGFHEATMVFRVGTEQRLHGIDVDTAIVEAVEVPDMLAEGWHRTPVAAREAAAEQRLRETQEAEDRRVREEAARVAAAEKEVAELKAAEAEKANAAKDAASDKPKATKADVKAGSGA